MNKIIILFNYFFVQVAGSLGCMNGEESGLQVTQRTQDGVVTLRCKQKLARPL